MEKRLHAHHKFDLKLIVKILDSSYTNTPIYFSAQMIDVSAEGMLIQSRGLSIPAYRYLLVKGHIQLLYQNPLTRNIDKLAGTIARFKRHPVTRKAEATCTIVVRFADKQEFLSKELLQTQIDNQIASPLAHCSNAGIV